MRDGVVRVWWAEVRDLGAADHDLLDATERARLVRLKREEDRDRFVLGAALVRRLVADMEGVEAASVALDRACPRCGAQHGPVSVPGRRWRCSVAHAGSLAVAAVALTPVGVDLEVSCPPDWRSLVKEVVAPGEPEPVDQAGFLSTWVRKEAVVKATREGLLRSLTTVDLSAPPPACGCWTSTCRAPPLPWPAPAVTGRRPQVDVRRWPPAGAD